MVHSWWLSLRINGKMWGREGESGDRGNEENVLKEIDSIIVGGGISGSLTTSVKMP